MTDAPTFMTPEQAIARLGVDMKESTIVRYARQGLIPHHKVARKICFTQDDLDAYEAATAVPATGSGRSKGSRKRKIA